jgi:hypothetical protein
MPNRAREYVGQTGRTSQRRYKEHIRDIKKKKTQDSRDINVEK